jgi:1,4-dihydroxy-6-naphthoate synthase
MSRVPLSIAYSPCPNDTYIFAAWTKGLLAGAPPVSVVLDDVEALNEAALAGRYALTKVSYGAIPYLLDRYRILRAGGALGHGCGPLVVARPDPTGDASALETLPPSTLETLPPRARIAIPGAMTTAYLLLRLALQHPVEAVPMRFDRIVDAVARGDVDAGLIIHESRFTYQRAGLVPLGDLGAWWEAQTGHPIPLGAILARRDLDDEATALVDETIRASLDFARADEAAVAPYVREHAFEMEEDVMRAHIALYVNEYSRDVGDGIAAIAALFERAAAARLIPAGARPEFTPA